jgi:pyruvate-formate lyase-activating enzyme
MRFLESKSSIDGQGLTKSTLAIFLFGCCAKYGE